MPPAPPRADYGVLTELVGYHLRRAQAAVFSHFLKTIGDEGITPGQFGVLVLIDANAGLSQSALAKALGVKRSTMVAVIDRLEQLGWVERMASETDRRSYALALTKKGIDTLTRITPLVRGHEEHINAGLNEKEKATLIELLDRITRTARGP